MNLNTPASAQQIFAQWGEEDQELKGRVKNVRDWMREVEMFGIPHFGEAATRLRPLREQMVAHFAREDEMVQELSKICASASDELDSLKRRSPRDHSDLLVWIDSFMARLDELEPPFTSWQIALQEFEQFVESIERHENEEVEAITALL